MSKTFSASVRFIFFHSFKYIKLLLLNSLVVLTRVRYTGLHVLIIIVCV